MASERPAPSLSAIQNRIAGMRRPGVASTLARSLRERSEEAAAEAFSAGFKALGMPEAEVARLLGVDRRMIRDWRSGARQVPVWAILALPYDGVVAALEALANAAPPADDARRSA